MRRMTAKACMALAGLAGLTMTGASSQAGEAEPGTCKLSSPTLARLGYAVLPVELSRADRKALEQAERAVGKNDLVAAKKLLAPLAATYTEAAEVRFLLAAVHASEGMLAEACGDVAHLLELDLFAFAQRFETDPVFATLRASADGARLGHHAQAIETLWRQAAHDGLPAVMTRGARGSQDIWFARYLRGGVYLADTARFLPLDRGAGGDSSVLVHPGANMAALVKLTIVDCRDDDCPRVESVDVRGFRLDPWRQPPVRWRYRGENAHRLDLRLGPRGTAARVHDCCCYNGCVSPWETVGPKPSTPANPTEDELTMHLDVRGWLLALAPAGQQVRKGRLVSQRGEGGEGGEVQLSAKHASPLGIHQIFVDPTTGMRVVSTTLDGCDPRNPEHPILRHVVSKVDTDGKATVLVDGKGPATALLDGKQAFYLQIGDTVRRWPSLSAFASDAGAPGTPIMTGVTLVVPISADNSCGGL